MIENMSFHSKSGEESSQESRKKPLSILGPHCLQGKNMVFPPISCSRHILCNKIHLIKKPRSRGLLY